MRFEVRDLKKWCQCTDIYLTWSLWRIGQEAGDGTLQKVNRYRS